MIDVMRTMLAGLACGGLLATAGCTKTSDGSIEFQRQNMMPGMFGIQPKQAASAAPMVFPQPPAPAAQPIVVVRKKPSAQTARRRTAAAPAAVTQAVAQPKQPMTCQNETSPGGRVKFVCR
jgi:hypothetical protein